MRLVVLGSSLTALAVIRNAISNNMLPVLIDTKRDIASLSSQSIKFIQVEKSKADELDAVLSCASQDDYLIATSDSWLNFIISHRAKLEEAFHTIICPSNDVLKICLDKQIFAHWCEDNNLPAPRITSYSDAEANQKNKENFQAYFIRPINSAAQYTGIPKTIVVTQLDELQKQTDILRQQNVEFVITESLLGQELIQYSVPFVRTENGTRAYVATKVRPFAEMCAVGTYVSLEENSAIETIGRMVAEKLDYYGIGEVEILYSKTTQQSYIIEVNARPWIQYHLGVKSGYNFLKYLIDPDHYHYQGEKKRGKNWINFGDDLYVCFSRSEGHFSHGKLSLPQYLISIVKVNVFSTFSWSDMRPFISNIKTTIQLIFNKK